MTLFQFNQYDLTRNKFSSDIVWTLSKRNRLSIGCCAKFVVHVRCPAIISHPTHPPPQQKGKGVHTKL